MFFFDKYKLCNFFSFLRIKKKKQYNENQTEI